jgi:hypothetical protein
MVNEMKTTSGFAAVHVVGFDGMIHEPPLKKRGVWRHVFAS